VAAKRRHAFEVFGGKVDLAGSNACAIYLHAILEEAGPRPKKWMKQYTQEQVTKLKALLAASPLKKLSATGDAIAASGH
jgi:hypothetical protein